MSVYLDLGSQKEVIYKTSTNLKRFRLTNMSLQTVREFAICFNLDFRSYEPCERSTPFDEAVKGLKRREFKGLFVEVHNGLVTKHKWL